MLFPLTSLLTLLPLAPCSLEEQALQREVRVLELEGTPYERGLTHGRALRDEIQEIVADFRNSLQRTYGVEAEVFIERFLAETDFAPAIERWTPGLLEEVRGIAEGAQLPFEELFAWQLNDEIWSMGSWALRGGSWTERDKCTAVAVGPRGDQPAIVAQNMDIPGFYQKFPTLLRIREEGKPDTLVLTCPGMIGVNGMNASAVAVACNTLLQLRPSPTGVPCLFVVRGVLAHASLGSAEAWLKAVPHAVGQNYTIGDPSGVRAFECSAGGRVRFQPHAGSDLTYHTNHPLVSTDWHPDYLERCADRGVEPAAGLRACMRFASLEERFAPGQPIGVGTIQAALASRDHPGDSICGDWNYGCTIFVLREGAPELRLAPGRPDRFAFTTFGF